MNLSIVKQKKNIQHFLFLTTGCDANHLKTGFLWGGRGGTNQAVIYILQFSATMSTVKEAVSRLGEQIHIYSIRRYGYH